MGRQTGGAAVVESLRQEGVSHVFGLIGSATMEIYDALFHARDIKYVGVRHEACAVHMADAYARITGRAGVVLAGQNGPGVSNLATGLAQAFLAYSPVVVIAGAASSSHLDRGSFQEIDQVGLLRPITKSCVMVHQATRLTEYMQDAFRIAQTGRQGPTVVNIPRDALAAEIDVTARGSSTYRPVGGMAPTSENLRAAAALLRSARQPLILAGAGVKWSGGSADVMRLAEKLAAPIAAAAGHGDVVPSDHPLFAGQVGPRGNLVATELALQADVILALGTRIGFNTTFFTSDNISATAKIIQVDIEPSAIGRYLPISVGVVADAAEMARALLPLVTPAAQSTWVPQFQARRAELLESRRLAASTPHDKIQPAQVFGALQKALPRNAILTLDAGTCCLQATDVLQTFEVPGLITPLDFGLVGFSYAAGLGAKAARPDRPVISLMGDGGFAMTMGEIGTAMQSGLATIALVLNNGCWGAEKAYQRDFYGGRFIGADVPNPDYSVVARSFGANGIRVSHVDEVAPAVVAALRSEVPSVIEVPIDPDAIVSFRRDSFQHRVPVAAPVAV